MNDKEKFVLEKLQLVNAAGGSRLNHVINLNSIAEEILNKLQPSKVKLPKEIFNLLEEMSAYYKNDGINQLLWSALQGPSSDGEHKFIEIRKYANQRENAIKITKAILFGYELEETEEERIKRNIRETLHNGAGVMISNELVDRLYNIAKGESNV